MQKVEGKVNELQMTQQEIANLDGHVVPGWDENF
jgi:hypothetical protein